MVNLNQMGKKGGEYHFQQPDKVVSVVPGFGAITHPLPLIAYIAVEFSIIFSIILLYIYILNRETVPLLTSDMGKKTVSVLAHLFLLPQKTNSGTILSIPPEVLQK